MSRPGYVVYSDSNPSQVEAFFMTHVGVTEATALARANAWAEANVAGATVEACELDDYVRVTEQTITL